MRAPWPRRRRRWRQTIAELPTSAPRRTRLRQPGAALDDRHPRSSTPRTGADRLSPFLSSFAPPPATRCRRSEPDQIVARPAPKTTSTSSPRRRPGKAGVGSALADFAFEPATDYQQPPTTIHPGALGSRRVRWPMACHLSPVRPLHPGIGGLVQRPSGRFGLRHRHRRRRPDSDDRQHLSPPRPPASAAPRLSPGASTRTSPTAHNPSLGLHRPVRPLPGALERDRATARIRFTDSGASVVPVAEPKQRFNRPLAPPISLACMTAECETGRDQVCRPASIERPGFRDELAEVVGARARRQSRPPCRIGSLLTGRAHAGR